MTSWPGPTPPAPSLIPFPQSPLPTGHTFSPTAPPPFQSKADRERRAGVYSAFHSVFPSLSYSHTPPPVTHSPPSFSFGEAAIRPCPFLLTNRQSRKQAERDRKAEGEDWTDWQREASSGSDRFFWVWIKRWVGSLLSSPLEYHCRAGNLIPVPLLFPQLRQLRSRMLWRMVHQENCSYQVFVWPKWHNKHCCASAGSLTGANWWWFFFLMYFVTCSVLKIASFSLQWSFKCHIWK